MSFAQYMLGSFTFSQYLDFFARVLVACVCGGLIGYERSRRHKEAGLRTHIIVCCAAAFMMIVSKYGFADLARASADGIDMAAKTADPARIAAQIITGVSFLGAGIIFHNNNSVKGLSTAAGVWATAGIGMAIGAGMYIIGLFATAVLFVVQWIVRKIETGRDTFYTTQIRFTVVPRSEFGEQFEIFIKSLQHTHILESKIKFDEDGTVSYNITFRSATELTIEELNRFLEANSEVKSVSLLSM